MKQKYIELYMDWASRTAALSHAVRLKVGAIIVKDDTVLSYGYNGTAAGWDNTCENKEYCLSRDLDGNYFPRVEQDYPYEDEHGRYRLVTKPEVLHAERNALDKLTKRGGTGSRDSIMFSTHAPCLECAKSIYGAGIKKVFYRDQYRSTDGIVFLEKSGVEVVQVK